MPSVCLGQYVQLLYQKRLLVGIFMALAISGYPEVRPLTERNFAIYEFYRLLKFKPCWTLLHFGMELGGDFSAMPLQQYQGRPG